MKAIVYSKAGNKKSEVVLNPEIFAARVNTRLLELVKNAYSANLRHGTADTKVRKEVRGGGKKPWRQKGTGRARHGSTRSPIWKGGGTVFGPHPRSYFVNLPKTMKDKALISALSLRGDQKSLILLEDVKLQSPKTKEWIEVVRALPLEGKKTICVVKEVTENLERASRNVSKLVEIRRASDVNAFHILQREKVVLEQGAIAVLEGRLLEEGAQKTDTAAEAAPATKKPAAKRKKTVSKATRAASKRATKTKSKSSKSDKKS